MSNLDFERRLDQAIRRRVDQAIRQEIGERLQAMLSRDAVDIPPRLRELVGRLDGDQDLGREDERSTDLVLPDREKYDPNARSNPRG
jgi:hypothetical protein